MTIEKDRFSHIRNAVALAQANSNKVDPKFADLATPSPPSLGSVQQLPRQNGLQRAGHELNIHDTIGLEMGPVKTVTKRGAYRLKDDSGNSLHLAKFLRTNCRLDETELERKFLKTAENPHSHLDKLVGWSIIESKAHSTSQGYWNCLNQVEKYWCKYLFPDTHPGDDHFLLFKVY